MVKGVSPKTSGGINNLGGNAKLGDYAYFPGTGPEGKSCDECRWMIHSKGAKTYGRCIQAAIIRRLQLDDVHYVDRWAAACKFFGGRMVGVHPWHYYKGLTAGLVLTHEIVAAMVKVEETIASDHIPPHGADDPTGRPAV